MLSRGSSDLQSGLCTSHASVQVVQADCHCTAPNISRMYALRRQAQHLNAWHVWPWSSAAQCHAQPNLHEFGFAQHRKLLTSATFCSTAVANPLRADLARHLPMYCKRSSAYLVLLFQSHKGPLQLRRDLAIRPHDRQLHESSSGHGRPCTAGLRRLRRPLRDELSCQLMLQLADLLRDKLSCRLPLRLGLHLIRLLRHELSCRMSLWLHKLDHGLVMLLGPLLTEVFLGWKLRQRLQGWVIWQLGQQLAWLLHVLRL